MAFELDGELKMDLLKTMGAAGIALLCAGAAHATPVLPVSFTVETATCALANGAVPGCGVASRRDTGAINLGSPDTSFYSLGLGGELVLHFNQALRGITSFFETTWGNPDLYKEEASFSVSTDGVNWTDIGVATNWLSAGISTFTVGSSFTWLRLVDKTSGTGGDGFDLNALQVTVDENTPITPAPAAAVLLGSALLAGGALRRRNRRAA